MQTRRIQAERPSGTTGCVVAGVGGSAGLFAAQYAADQAQHLGQPLVLVHAFSWPWVEAPLAPVGPTARDSARALLTAVAARVRHDHPGLVVTTEAVEGRPAKVLEERSRRAALLVVGYHGHGGLSDPLAGSVAEHVARHAHCTVVLARDGDDGRTAAHNRTTEHV
jgi:nucleotide-binding universal stress UspA family protein